MTAPRFAVEAIDLFERQIDLRMPFRFGVVTLTAAPAVPEPDRCARIGLRRK